MYICEHCKEVFEEPFVHVVRESRGEFWGMPAYETMFYEYCPYCGREEFSEYHEEEEELEDEEC